MPEAQQEPALGEEGAWQRDHQGQKPPEGTSEHVLPHRGAGHGQRAEEGGSWSPSQASGTPAQEGSEQEPPGLISGSSLSPWL